MYLLNVSYQQVVLLTIIVIVVIFALISQYLKKNQKNEPAPNQQPTIRYRKTKSRSRRITPREDKWRKRDKGTK